MGALQSTDEYWLDELDDYQMQKLGMKTSSAPTKCQDFPIGRGLADLTRVTDQAISATATFRYTSTRRLEDEYHLLPQVCGAGGNGAVQLAKNGDGKLFAVKSFNLSSMSVSMKQDLLKEVKIGLAADHPHIVHVENVYETQDELHLVMEHLSGGELFSHLAQKGQFSEEKAAVRTHQMLSAIAYLHRHGVAHRDLKLENWIYDGPDKKHLKLIDFGVSKCWDESVPMHQVCGSTSYMAPEVFNKSYTEKADMWSLGVIVYSLLTGRSLFSGTEAEVERKIKSGRVDWSSMAFELLSADAKHFVQALIVKDPLHRMSAEEALEHPWLASVRGKDPVPVHGEVVSNLLRSAPASRFKRACLCMLTSSLGSKEVEQLRKQFLELERECQGAISLKRLMQSIDDKKSLADLASEHALQVDDDTEVSYSEFIAVAMHDRLTMNDSAMSKLFQQLDPVGDGISVEHLCERLGYTHNGTDAATIIGEISPNHGGAIGFEELSGFLKRPSMLSNNTLGLYEPEPEPGC